MPDKPADREVSLQIELAICQLQSLSAMPETVGKFLSGLNQYQLSPSALTELIETDPAIAIQIMRHFRQRPNAEAPCSIRLAVEGLPLRQIRDAVLAVGIYSAKPEEQNRFAFRKELIRHSIAVGCCARQIAETAVSDVDPDLAYLAGLLHDIGKLAIDQILPKSFVRILEIAKKQQDSTCDIERQNLGIDHTIIGKRLSERWQLPAEISVAIWLHHSDLVRQRQAENLPDVKIAGVIQLADVLARQAGLGQSGSFDVPLMPQKLLESLSISDTHIEQIRSAEGGFAAEFERKAGLIDSKTGDTYGDFCDTVRQTAAQLADENQHLSKEKWKLQTDAESLKFIKEFLAGINPETEVIEIARKFAVEFQRFYQAGAVCLYLLPTAGQKSLPAVVVQNQAQNRLLLLQVPAGNSAVPGSIAENFAVAQAADLDWLFEQIDVAFEPARTKIVPFLSDGKIAAVLVFEMRQLVSDEQLREILEPIGTAAAAVFAAASAGQKQRYYAEQFAQVRTTETPQTETSPPTVKMPTEPQKETILPFEALTEMAAGAAHELNNPLVVISGRAELLAGAEQDEQKKKILVQISENARKISQIIDELMSFASPAGGQSRQVNLRQVIDKALQLAMQKAKMQSISAKIEIAEDAAEIFADPDQITTAIANIICNATESYLTKTGPVKIAAQSTSSGKFVKLAISDMGCGMDEQTVRRAALPFFSAKPAGRKRGMGLAIAKRLIELNGGTIEIASKPGEGTTINILLPVR
jgi:putative nucleotidyltransferase with HDIG domain